MNVAISYEEARHCGFRKPAKDGVGIYLRGVGEMGECERLPFVLESCPCCGGGILPSRGFTWINPIALFDPYNEPRCTMVYGQSHNQSHDHDRCWMCNPSQLGDKAGLVWIGEAHYKTPRDFAREARKMGISRKIAAIPNGFEVGKHVIFLAHKRVQKSTVSLNAETWKAGVFMVFKPTFIDLVIDDPDNVPSKAIEIAKRLGKDKCRIVKVIPETEDAVVSEWSDLE